MSSGIRDRRRWSRITATAILSAVLALVGFQSLPAEPDHDLRIVGSRSMQAPVEEWMSMYRLAYPHVRAHSAMYGTGLAAGAIALRRADIAPLAREMQSGERALIADATPLAIHVGERRGPANRPIFLYIARDRDGRPDRGALAFARIATSREGQARLANGGFEALSSEAREETIAELDQLGR